MNFLMEIPLKKEPMIYQLNQEMNCYLEISVVIERKFYTNAR